MADFVAVLRKTIDGLGETTPEIRARVYEKARTTISAKLAAITPPPAPAVIERQKSALETAIKAVELRYAVLPLTPSIDDFDEVMKSLEATPLPNSHPEAEPSAQIEKPLPRSRTIPAEPTIVEGPNFQVRAGKLSLSISPPGASELAGQQRLQGQLQRMLHRAEPLLEKVENKFPELVRASREYASIISADIAEIDVVSTWAVGGALIGFSEAYRQQNINRTMSEPLEPEVSAMLDSIIRTHGAFVMGFEEGRDLVRKADEFLVDSNVLTEIAKPGADLLDALALNKRIVEERTLRANRPIADYVNEFGWQTSRVGYSAYVLVRNIAFELVRLTIGRPQDAAGVLSKVAVLSGVAFGDPNFELVKSAGPIILHHSAQLLAFFKHSPEFRAYIEWAIEVLSEDRASLSEL